MWISCPKTEAFWHELIRWIETLINQKIDMNETLLLFSLFTGGNEKLENKE